MVKKVSSAASLKRSREDSESRSGENRPSGSRHDGEALLMDTIERKLMQNKTPQRVNNIGNNQMIVNDQTECKISSVNNKMFFIINKENYLYKHYCLTRAKEVSCQGHKKIVSF